MLPRSARAKHHSLMRTEHRRLVQAAAAILGYSAHGTAERLGCSYNHLLLVLNGDRNPSERLARQIAALIEEATPELLGALERYEHDRAERWAPIGTSGE